MPVDYQFKKGIDMPSWQWLSFFPPGNSSPGSSNVYDGKRYMYWAIQYGTTTAGTASTCQLWRYDTWTNGWQFLAGLTNGNQGMDLEYDNTRNVIYITNGAALTSMQVFNLNLTSVTVLNQACAAFTLTTISIALPAAASIGASLTMPDDSLIPATIDAGTADSSGNTTTTVKATDATGTFGGGMVGLQLRVTSGTQNNQKRLISGVTDKNTVTLASALPGALASGDTFVIELVSDTATGGTTSTLTQSTAVWTVNQYSNHDVVIVSGTGSGQRRRIASNTATVLTLATATTGNARTGNFTTAPDATSVFKIVPSADFLYYQPGNATTTLYRIDVAQTTGAAWSAALAASPAGISGGGNTFFPASYAPYSILAVRGAASSNVYLYNIGLNSWSTPAQFWAAETITTGASAAMVTGRRKIFIAKEGSQRTYMLDLLTNTLEPGPMMPYAAPSAHDGKRARYVKTPDGVEWMYLLRAGGSEFFRIPLEWL